MRWRFAVFALLILVQAACFTGQWRIGRDSALYREIARNLEQGKGYTFRGERENHGYPGAPMLLQGINAAFGPQDPYRPVAALTVMTSLSLLSLVLAYHLVGAYYPKWAAVAVVTALGINQIFLSQSHELLTDVPFLAATLMVLFGLSRLDKGAKPIGAFVCGVMVVAGVVAAVTLRPTFWVLLAALGGACVINIARRPKQWGGYLIGLAAVALVAFLWIKLDPRTEGDPLGGRYERRAAERVQNLANAQSVLRLRNICEKHLPEAVVGIELGPAGYLIVVLLLGGAVLLLRVSSLWSLLVLGTIGMTAVMGSRPRYYLMAMPLMLLAVGLAVAWISQKFKDRPRLAGAIIAACAAVVLIPNIVKDVAFGLEQHGIDKQLTRRPFLETYHHSLMLGIDQISDAIRQQVPEGAGILAPEARILTFLGDRFAYDPRVDLLKDREEALWPKALIRWNIQYCVVRDGDEKDMAALKRLTDAGLVTMGQELATAGHYRLYRVKVRGGV